MRSTRSLLDIDDLSSEEFDEVIRLSASELYPKVLSNRSVALLFEKPSARTRNAAEVAIRALGGGVTSIADYEVGLGSREAVSDVAMTLGSYHDLIGARVKSHETLVQFRDVSRRTGVGVVNLLSDFSHPTQAVADILTMRESIQFGGTDFAAPVKVAYVGDSNNVTRSLAKACSYVGFDLAIASPKGYDFTDEEISSMRLGDGRVDSVSDPTEACFGANFVYTDVWVSMGQEGEAAQRIGDFEGYRVTSELMRAAAPGAKFMHCLPAHRGIEVDADVIDGAASIVWLQAKARMAAMRGIMLFLFAEIGGV